jgi:hypothetical protein
MFLLWVIAPTNDAKGITRKLIPKALSKGKPARLSKGILTVPPPIPNIPLTKPAKRPIRRYIIICVIGSIQSISIYFAPEFLLTCSYLQYFVYIANFGVYTK